MTTTGLGDSDGGGLSNSECSGGGPAEICTDCGRKPALANETACVSGGMASAQGVWQV
jgi:hypothetical protein